VQDELVRIIVGTVAGRIQAAETARACRKPPSGLSAHELLLRGNSLSWDDRNSAAQAKRAFARAIEIDPLYGRPYSLLATMLGREWRDDASGNPALLDRALALAQHAVELATNDSTAHTALGYIHFERWNFDIALRHMERGVEINPANPWNGIDLGYLLSYMGRSEEAVTLLQDARRRDPYIEPAWYWRSLGVAQFALRRYAEALADFERGAANAPRYALAMMAGCCAKLGLSERAATLMQICRADRPNDTQDNLVARVPFRHASDRRHLAECLRLAERPPRDVFTRRSPG
jgi:tetratricopeptide (TPR) repeat protein